MEGYARGYGFENVLEDTCYEQKWEGITTVAGGSPPNYAAGVQGAGQAFTALAAQAGQAFNSGLAGLFGSVAELGNTASNYYGSQPGSINNPGNAIAQNINPYSII